MFGTLDAAAGWAEDYTGTLIDGGFDKGGASPCHFRHKEKNVNLLVHGDDFFAVGREGDLGHLKKTLEAKYELKTQMIGPHPNDQKSMKVLGRIISYHDWGIQYESDPSHLELALKTMNMVGCKTVTTPWVKESVMSATERGAIQSRRNGEAPPKGSKTPARLQKKK